MGYRPIVDFGNLVSYTAFGLGNHDFDEGVEGLVPFIREANYPVLAANIVSIVLSTCFVTTCFD